MKTYNFNELKKQYFEYLKNRDNKNASIQYYHSILNEFNGQLTMDEYFIKANKIINNSELKNNSKALKCRVLIAFTNKLKEFTNEYWDDSKIKRKKAEQTRTAYNNDEINLLLDELKNFNNKKFEYIFKFLLLTGIRVSEWENIDWKEFVEKNESGDYWIKANKDNNARPLFLLDNYENFCFNDKVKNFKSEFIKMLPELKWTIQTIKNNFNLFKIFISNKYLNFNKPVSAHMLRHTYITNLYLNGLSPEKIMEFTGHKNPSILRQTYIAKGHNYQYNEFQNIINNVAKTTQKLEQKELINDVITLNINDLKEFIKQTISEQNVNSLDNKLKELSNFIRKQ